MKIIRAKDYADMSRKAANIISDDGGFREHHRLDQLSRRRLCGGSPNLHYADGPVSYTHLDVYKRQELVKVISDATGARVEYKFMPTCNYEIDYFTVNITCHKLTAKVLFR